MIETAIERPGGAAGLTALAGEVKLAGLADPRLEAAGRALAARFGGGAAAVPSAGAAAVPGAGGAVAGAHPASDQAMSAVAGGRAVEAAAQAEPVRWAESLTATLPAPAAFAVLEHLFGVMPLLAACFAPAPALEAAAAGRRLGALGLFTPAPELSWDAAAVTAEPDGGMRLHGLVRIPFAGADGVLLPARLPGGELRLVWLEDGGAGPAGGAVDAAGSAIGLAGAVAGKSAGAGVAAAEAGGTGTGAASGLAAVERRGERGGGAVHAGAPCWIAIDGAIVGAEAVSRPVTLGPGGDAGRVLESYARVWGLAAAITAGMAVTALRRAARTTAHDGRAWSASQLVAMDLAELEIEAELAAVALRAEPAPAATATVGAFAMAAAAARVLAAVAAKTAELRELGLAPEGPLADEGAARCLTAFLGGALRLESEAAGALGLRDLEAAPPAQAGA